VETNRNEWSCALYPNQIISLSQISAQHLMILIWTLVYFFHITPFFHTDNDYDKELSSETKWNLST
jgi:hypothetical protein